MRLYRFRGRVQEESGEVHRFDGGTLRDLLDHFFRNLSIPGDPNVPPHVAIADLAKRVNWVCAGLVSVLVDPARHKDTLAQMLHTAGFIEFEMVCTESSKVAFYRKFALDGDKGFTQVDHLSWVEAEEAWKAGK